MAKLWEKGYSLNQQVEQFMTGDDPALDLRLLKHDCKASAAHAKMLEKIGVLTSSELQQLEQCLQEVLDLDSKGEFKIEASDEDVHTALEGYLINKLGTVGRKIHTARSRNDQVVTALRLFMKEQVIVIGQKLSNTINELIAFSEKNLNIPMVGRTHFQKAMPSSVGLWMGALIESLLDDTILMQSAFTILDQCPLGSAASYGVSLHIDRELTAKELNFAKVQNNVLYANNSRGKFETILLHALSQIMLDLAKLSTDVIIFSAPEFGYLKLPIEFCPGSSLMPNKKNPDPFELIRAKSAGVCGDLFKIMEVIRGLPSGYNRDFQETKRPLFEAIDTVSQTLDVVAIIFAGVTVDVEACHKGFTPEVFATDEVLKLVTSGTAFRDAYKDIGTHLEDLKQHDPVANILAKTHVGATGALNLNLSKTNLSKFQQWLATASL